MAIFGFVAFLVFGIAQFIAGVQGIAAGIGVGWAIAAVAAALMFRFTLPITIGSFFGAMNVWGWPWFFAALFAAPGLILVVPGVLGMIFSLVKRDSTPAA
jgi:hypothetical protein